jgi:hypothetical protein
MPSSPSPRSSSTVRPRGVSSPSPTQGRGGVRNGFYHGEEDKDGLDNGNKEESYMPELMENRETGPERKDVN